MAGCALVSVLDSVCNACASGNGKSARSMRADLSSRSYLSFFKAQVPSSPETRHDACAWKTVGNHFASHSPARCKHVDKTSFQNARRFTSST